MGICESKPNVKYITENVNQIQFKPQNNSIIKTINKSELYTGHKPIPMKIANEVLKSICKIKIRTKEEKIKYGTGFFMNISQSSKYLITNYHVISKKNLNDDIEIEIHNHKNMKLNLHNRDIKYYPKPKDIVIIEIKNDDEIYNDIQFLDYDSNYNKKGYLIYNNIDVFCVEHPLGNESACASGQIITISDFEFEHSIPTNNGSSGSPIILLNNNINLIQVIGIHKEANYSKKLNCGTFIGEIFKNNDKNDNIKFNNNTLNIKDVSNLNSNLNKNYHVGNLLDVCNSNNYILAEIDIKDEDINKNIRILNSYEEKERHTIYINHSRVFYDLFKNEGEIKECEIQINNQPIKFNYFHTFTQKGKYIIKYSFNKYLTKTNSMFELCNSLTNIDLSNFNTRNNTNMTKMFKDCKALKHIDLINVNTQNVTNMREMFDSCYSLTNLDLSNFDTGNVTDMSYMFKYCKSLINLDLSNFNTRNVTEMMNMFGNCESLINLDLSNFNTQNIKKPKGYYIQNMFYGCKSLMTLNSNDKDLLFQFKDKDTFFHHYPLFR